ncbi:hypothetical protein VTN96DRAFT_7119 [Rasamsonia emersonii]
MGLTHDHTLSGSTSTVITYVPRVLERYPLPSVSKEIKDCTKLDVSLSSSQRDSEIFQHILRCAMITQYGHT